MRWEGVIKSEKFTTILPNATHPETTNFSLHLEPIQALNLIGDLSGPDRIGGCKHPRSYGNSSEIK